jgi:hypothetical protein
LPLEGIAVGWDPSSSSAPSIFVSRDVCSSSLNGVLSPSSLPPSTIAHSKTLGGSYDPGSRILETPPVPRFRHRHTTSLTRDHLPTIFTSLGFEYDDKVLPSIGNEVLKVIVTQFLTELSRGQVEKERHAPSQTAMA